MWNNQRPCWALMWWCFHWFGNGNTMALQWLLCFPQEMAVWMSEDNSYLQHRVLVIICRVLNFASRKVKGYVSDSVLSPCFWSLHFCRAVFQDLAFESMWCLLGLIVLVSWDIGKGVNILHDSVNQQDFSSNWCRCLLLYTNSRSESKPGFCSVSIFPCKLQSVLFTETSILTFLLISPFLSSF